MATAEGDPASDDTWEGPDALKALGDCVPAASDLQCTPEAFCASVAAEFRKQQYYDKVTFTLKSGTFHHQVLRLLGSKGYGVSCGYRSRDPNVRITVGLSTVAFSSRDAAAVIHPAEVGTGAEPLPHVSHLRRCFLSTVVDECLKITDAIKQRGTPRFRFSWKDKPTSFCLRVEYLMEARGYTVTREGKGRHKATVIEVPPWGHRREPGR